MRSALPSPIARGAVLRKRHARAHPLTLLLACALLLPALAAGPALPQVPTSAAPAACGPSDGPGGSSGDLYCIELLPGAAAPEARGVARLLPVPSPYGIAVSASGEPAWSLAFEVEGLPAPSSLGAYRTYVAWVTTPQLDPVIRLGEVGNGRAALSRVTFERFLVLITAEPSADVPARSGPLVLRGSSAAVGFQPHDLAFLLAGLAEASHATASSAWPTPPMHPSVAMPPAFMRLRPPATPYLPADSDTLPLARPRELLRPSPGDTITLVASRVRRVLFGRTIVMLGFNGQVPGPLIQVDQSTEIVIRFINRTDFPTAVHWHGVRLDNRFDGVPHVTQEPVDPGETFDYRVRFPDAGLYWYHPHHREDVLQDLGLYGNLLVRSREPGYYAPANREDVLMLDDLLVGETGPVPWGRDTPTHALMGRFGNVLLINGEPRWSTRVAAGAVVRLFLTNVSNTRVFNLSLTPGARMKLVASDLGRYEHEVEVDHVTIAPAERYVVDVRFETEGRVALINRVRAVDHVRARFFEEVDTLGLIDVEAGPAVPDHRASFEQLRHDTVVSAELERYRAHFERPPDHTLRVTLETDSLPFPLGPLLGLESGYRSPVEWSGTMPEMDWLATGRHVRWILRDEANGRENMDITWRFQRGDVVRLRLISDRNAIHVMQHPIHIHGQRFLVLAVNGVANPHRVWKDTVLLPAGFTVDLLVEMTNPGRWMLHCHIAEHIETGMRMVFQVE